VSRHSKAVQEAPDVSKAIAAALCVLASAVCPRPSALAAPPKFSLTQLASAPRTGNCEPRALGRGSVVGYCVIRGAAFPTFATVWSGGKALVLETALAGSRAFAMNYAGMIVGMSAQTAEQSHPVMWLSRTQGSKSLPVLANYGVAFAINASGVIVGSSNVADGIHAVLWKNLVIKDLGTLGGYVSEAFAINDGDTIVGYSQIEKGSCGPRCTGRHATTWTLTGSATALPGLVADPQFQYTSTANAVNRAGTIVGEAEVSAGHSHAVSWTGGQITDLATLGGDSSKALGVNSVGHIVGSASDPNRSVAALWESGSVWDLNKLLSPANDQVHLAEARAISDADEIVAVGFDSSLDERQQVYLLKPIT